MTCDRGANPRSILLWEGTLLMKKKLLFVGLTMVGTLYTSCVGQAIIWALTGAGGLFVAS